ncbi:hypothetical protein XM38_006930 [Halomicronema hongdechloris C2206]|uniref:Uncharacterized protein n=1 Tax=Halomicronema hongdechloris C2206 TaxID=1641165 RepID=A0A1Z3HHJ6_9CYAN|nr:hypothetical protein XM38_006930 [Halomicronema hongdechloris C2206]
MPLAGDAIADLYEHLSQVSGGLEMRSRGSDVDTQSQKWPVPGESLLSAFGTDYMEGGEVGICEIGFC